MITHVVSFRWKPETTQNEIDLIRAGLSTMPNLVPMIRTYRYGSDVAGSEANMDFAIVATFDSMDEWSAYDEHPEHVRLRSEVIRPWIAERAVVQFES